MANLLYFSQPDHACPTCRKWHAAHVLDNVSALLNDERIAHHDAQREPGLATQYHVQSTPTLLDMSAGYPQLIYPAPGLPELPAPQALVERIHQVRSTL